MSPAALLYAQLAPYAHLFFVDGIGAALMGSVERTLGNMAMLAGDLDAAAGHFERALEANAAIGAPLPGRQRPPAVRRAVAAPRRARRRRAPESPAARGGRLLREGGHQ